MTKYVTFNQTFWSQTFKPAQRCCSFRSPQIITGPCWVSLPSSPILPRMTFSSLEKVMEEFTRRPSVSAWLLKLPTSTSRWDLFLQHAHLCRWVPVNCWQSIVHSLVLWLCLNIGLLSGTCSQMTGWDKWNRCWLCITTSRTLRSVVPSLVPLVLMSSRSQSCILNVVKSFKLSKLSRSDLYKRVILVCHFCAADVRLATRGH